MEDTGGGVAAPRARVYDGRSSSGFAWSKYHRAFLRSSVSLPFSRCL